MARLGRLASVVAALAPLLEAVLLNCGVAVAQEPDSIAAQVQDSAAVQDSTAVPVPDSLAAADSAVVRAFPIFPAMASRDPGIAWQWNFPDILGTGALTFAHLVEYTPFMNPVRTGFVEGPEVAVFAGRGAASLRFNTEGYEIVPLLGGALDLRLIPLVQQQQIRLIREPGGYRVSEQTYRNPRSDPYSRIEAGTGDKRTNLLRAFLSSRVSKAVVTFGFDRVDTNGGADVGASKRTVVMGSLAVPMPAGLWAQLEYRGVTADRELFPNPERTDWIFRLRRAFSNGWYADLVAGSAKVKQEAVVGPGVPDSLLTPPLEESARQVALRGAKTAEHWQAFLSLRFWDGEGVPVFEPEASFELQTGPASFFASGRFAHWEKDFETAAGYASLIVDLPLGLRAMAEVEEGDRGLFGFEPLNWMEFGRWTLGGDLKLWRWRIGGRGGRWRTTPSPGLGEPIDSVASLPGGTVTVVEAWAGGPLFRLFGGVVDLGGRYTAREDGLFLYWPSDEWQVDGTYRLTALNGQLGLQIIGKGGVRGSMWVSDRDTEPDAIVSTGDLRWWRAAIILRIKDVHIFYNYEYFDSIGIVGDIPGQGLPSNRYHFGLKWEFWN